MGLRQFSTRKWLLIMFFAMKSSTLASPLSECAMCDNCQHLGESAHCFCESRYHQDYYSGYYRSYITLTCKNVKLNSYINFDSAQSYSTIFFTNSHIDHLKINLLRGMTNVDAIYLNGTEIKDIQVGSFSSLSTIKQIYLQQNRLTRVIRGCFNSLFYLKTLDLHSNQISSIEEDSFHGLTSLKDLNIADNKLNNLSHTLLSYLYNLNTFNVSKNALKTIDFQFSIPYPTNMNASKGPMTQMTTLDLSENKLHELPLETLGKMENLKLLDISGNDLSDLRISMFSNLQKLQIFRMHSLKLDHLDVKEFVILTNLMELNIQSNEFKFFDDDILNFCPNLKSIAIDGNKFSCSVVASMIMNSKRRHITIEYTRSYQNENIDGIQCSRTSKAVSDLSKNISHILHDQINVAFRDLLNNISTSITTFGDKTEKADLSDDKFSEILGLIKEIKNSTNMKKAVDDNEYLEIMKIVKENSSNNDLISDHLKKMEMLHERIYRIMKSIIKYTSTEENNDSNGSLELKNKAHKNPNISELLESVRLNDDKDREYIKNVMSKVDYFIFFSVTLCLVFIFILILLIDEKKLWLKLKYFKKRQESSEELSTLAS